MILIDTNIISEMMKSSPSAKVIGWMSSQDAAQLYVASITIAEIAYGLYILPDGKRRHTLEDAFEKTIQNGFKGRVLAFDESVVHLYGNIMGRRKELGRPMDVPDGQIAAIARAYQCQLATRNIKDFQDCDLELINPFIF